MNRRLPGALLAALACAIICPGGISKAQAQAWPSKPITIVVPQPAGGAIDALARGLGDDLAKRLNVPVVVDNKPGASGMLGVQAVAHAAPDGYTLLVVNSTPVLTAPFVFSKVPYDVKKDLSLITQIAGAQMYLAINADIPARTMSEFIDWGKRNGSTASFGSPGVGTLSHLNGAWLNQSRNLDMTHVPFKGEPPLVQEMLAGRIAWGITTLAPLVPHLRSGKLRALAVIADKRQKEMPDVPTMAEAGLTDAEFKPLGWVGLIAPSGTPAPILERIEKEAREAVRAPETQKRLEAVGLGVIGSSSAQFRSEFDAAIPVIERMVKVSGARLD